MQEHDFSQVPDKVWDTLTYKFALMLSYMDEPPTHPGRQAANHRWHGALDVVAAWLGHEVLAEMPDKGSAFRFAICAHAMQAIMTEGDCQ